MGAQSFTQDEWNAWRTQLPGYSPGLESALWDEPNEAKRRAREVLVDKEAWIDNYRSTGNVGKSRANRAYYRAEDAAEGATRMTMDEMRKRELSLIYGNMAAASAASGRGGGKKAVDPYANIYNSGPRVKFDRWTDPTNVDFSRTPDWERFNAGVLDPARRQLTDQVLPMAMENLSGGAYGSGRDSGTGQRMLRSTLNDYGMNSMQARAGESARAEELGLKNDVLNKERAIETFFRNQGLTGQEFQSNMQATQLALQIANARRNRGGGGGGARLGISPEYLSRAYADANNQEAAKHTPWYEEYGGAVIQTFGSLVGQPELGQFGANVYNSTLGNQNAANALTEQAGDIANTIYNNAGQWYNDFTKSSQPALYNAH